MRRSLPKSGRGAAPAERELTGALAAPACPLFGVQRTAVVQELDAVTGGCGVEASALEGEACCCESALRCGVLGQGPCREVTQPAGPGESSRKLQGDSRGTRSSMSGMHPEANLSGVRAHVEDDKTARESIGLGIGDREHREVTTLQAGCRISLDHHPHRLRRVHRLRQMPVPLNGGVCGAFGERCRISRLKGAQPHVLAQEGEEA